MKNQNRDERILNLQKRCCFIKRRKKPPSVKDILEQDRASFESFRDVQKQLMAGLRGHDLAREGERHRCCGLPVCSHRE
jgi:hypothetical protein